MLGYKDIKFWKFANFTNDNGNILLNKCSIGYIFIVCGTKLYKIAQICAGL